MSFGIIIKDKPKIPRQRSEVHRIMQSEGWGGAGLSNEQADKCKFLEKHIGKKHFTQKEIDKVK